MTTYVISVIRENPVLLDNINMCKRIENILIIWEALAQRSTCVSDVSFASLLFLHCTVRFIWQEIYSYFQQIYKTTKLFISNIIFACINSLTFDTFTTLWNQNLVHLWKRISWGAAKGFFQFAAILCHKNTFSLSLIITYCQKPSVWYFISMRYSLFSAYFMLLD